MNYLKRNWLKYKGVNILIIRNISELRDTFPEKKNSCGSSVRTLKPSKEKNNYFLLDQDGVHRQHLENNGDAGKGLCLVVK